MREVEDFMVTVTIHCTHCGSEDLRRKGRAPHMLLLALVVMLLLPMGLCLIFVVFGPSATFRKDPSSPKSVGMAWGTPAAVGSPAYREWESQHRRDSDQPKDGPPEVS